MPQSIELILGFSYKNREHFDKAIEALDIDLNVDIKKKGEMNETDVREMNFDESINDVLIRSHRDAMTSLGFTDFTKEDRYVSAETSLGKRTFAPFVLDLFFDPYEMYEGKDEMVVGVAISGRYFPTFADWKDPNGTLTPMIFDDELMKNMQLAKDAISKELPIFKDAIWIVKEIWY